MSYPILLYLKEKAVAMQMSIIMSWVLGIILGSTKQDK